MIYGSHKCVIQNFSEICHSTTVLHDSIVVFRSVVRAICGYRVETAIF